MASASGFAADRVVVVGAGIGGLAASLRLAPLPVTLIAGDALGNGTATSWAQGGIAAALDTGDDPSLHAADTLVAGAGLSDRDVAIRVTKAAGDAIEDLIAYGVRFDRTAAGTLALGLEAAHSRRRIVHAGGDGTGRELMKVLTQAAWMAPHVKLYERAWATSLCVDDGRVTGVRVRTLGNEFALPARAVVLATGGIGGLYAQTSNPLGAVGSGLALAARAGAVLQDIEFVQFHPTAIASTRDPMPLATEALRGEGAVLVNGRGEHFMADVPGGELASRDVVARAIWMELGRGEKVFLDARAAIGARLPERFPAVTKLCRAAGIDPVREPIPVSPAAHYLMGGIAVDLRGRTSVRGLWACGEVAATGFHGANRLASNSLLEAVVYARWIAEDIANDLSRPSRFSHANRKHRARRRPKMTDISHVRETMTNAVGVMRTETDLGDAIARLASLAADAEDRLITSDLALSGLCIAAAALQRRESRGAHFRSDHPHLVSGLTRSTKVTLEDVSRLVGGLGLEPFFTGGAA